jgi:hypothetical protein
MHAVLDDVSDKAKHHAAIWNVLHLAVYKTPEACIVNSFPTSQPSLDSGGFLL